jgi:hypothetical protein
MGELIENKLGNIGDGFVYHCVSLLWTKKPETKTRQPIVLTGLIWLRGYEPDVQLAKKWHNLNKSTERRPGSRKESRHGLISAQLNADGCELDGGEG